jgi:DNA-binding transcriptional LysR family regulator
MELRQLQYFVVLSEELHFGRAAERLHIVQPAVSQQLRRLERELGLTLLNRSTRRVTLTSAGHALLPGARAVLRAAQALRDTATELRPFQGAKLRLGTSAGLGEHLPALLAVLAQHDPGLNVELVRLPREPRLAAVAGGVLDAAFVRGGAPYPGVRLHIVWHDRLVAAVPLKHPVADQEEIPLAALEALTLYLPDRRDNAALVDLVEDGCRAAGFEPQRAPATNDEDMLAAIGAGSPSVWTVYYAPRAAQLASTTTGVAYRPVVEPQLSMPTALALPQAGLSESQELFLAACRAVASPPATSHGEVGLRAAQAK